MPKPGRKMLRLLAALLALTLISLLFILANGFIGNPVSRYLATRTAQRHLQTDYSHLDLELSKAEYDFKSGSYYAWARSQTSTDTYFLIWLSPTGELERDDYEDRVLNKYNTFERLSTAYEDSVRLLLRDPAFPFPTSIDYGHLAILQKGQDFGINLPDLVLDAEYEVKELGRSYGVLVLYAEDETVTAEKAGEMLLALKRLSDEKGVYFYAVDFSLFQASDAGKPDFGGPRINVSGFLYEDIHPVGLTERVQRAHEILEAEYAKLDAKRQKMIPEKDSPGP